MEGSVFLQEEQLNYVHVLSQAYRWGEEEKFTSPAVLWISGVPHFILGLKRVLGCWKGSCLQGKTNRENMKSLGSDRSVLDGWPTAVV